MYFKRLELSGFKSFADKTVLNFEPGTTAVVGPNGCGKSNISDAIQWVLGEQSAKTLRGSKMEDIIFDGTAERKPVGLSEVSLTLGDADSTMELGYNEITVTRRLFRSGESEYLINNNICRLKDINELIMGTGLGLSAYSVMGQGRMDEILKSKPEERRYLFEEAAGITKYKSKKNEALRKLEYTESNLLRLGDIISEVKRQINSVKRQATKAQKYKDVDDELRELEVRTAAYKYGEMKEAFAVLKEKSLNYDENEKQLHEELSSVEKDINRSRIELDGILSKISEIRENKFELAKRSENLKTKVAYNKERMEEIKKNSDLKKAELADLEKKAGELEEKEKNVCDDIRQITLQINDINGKVNSVSENLTKINAEINRKTSEIRQSKEKSIEVLSLNTKCKNEIIVIDQRERDIVLREKRFRVESGELDSKIENINRDLKIKTADLQRQQQHTKKIKKEIQDVESELASKQERISSIEHDRINLQKQKAEKNSKLEVLMDLKKKYEGFYEGVKDILRASRDSNLLEGIIGPVSEIIQVENGFELAFEVALGSNAQVVISGSVEEGTRALEHIKKNSKGRATFVAINNPKVIDRFNVSVLQNEEGFIGHILDFVKFEQRYNDVINYLLGDVVVFHDIDTALAASKKHNFPCDIATKSGEYVSSRCLISGGENESVLQGVVARESQILRLRDEIKNIEGKLNDLDSSYEQIDSENALLVGHSKDINSELYKNEINLANMNFEVARLQSLITQYNSDRERLHSEINFLSAEKAEVLEERSELKLSLEQTSRESDSIKKSIDDYDQEMGRLEDNKNDIMEQLTSFKITQNELKFREDSVKQRAATIASAKEDYTSRLDRVKMELTASGERTEKLAEENILSAEEIKSTENELSRSDAEEQKILGKKNSLSEMIKQMEDKLSGKRNSMSLLQEEGRDIEVKVTEYKLNMKNLKDNIWEEYKADLDINNDFDFSGTDWDQMETRISELKRKKESIGPVSLGAIEECEELEERLRFLTEQHEDLLKAKESLHTAIRTINATTRKLFTETFESIRSNFRETFNILFGGGKSDLCFVGEGDVLEAGIDVMATPPGKKLRHISQLSGGESALTAIALMFALFKVRPSPFCVLDEIDAPLDESNIMRFVNLLRDFTVNTQFIIITHNKKTIGISDVMYGITMEEKGISKVVSVKFAGKEPEVASA